MKRIKLSTYVILTGFFAALNFAGINTAFAQTQDQQTMGEKMKAMTPAQRADFQSAMMQKKLNLDSGQLAKVKAVNLKYAVKADPIIKSDDSKFSKFRKFKAMQEQKDAELKGIFTAEQFKQYQDYEAEMKEKMKEKMSNQ